MENKRFKTLSQLEINYYEVDVPVEVDKGVILLDTLMNQVLLQLKLRNISTKIIKFVEVDVECFDLTGNKVSKDYIVNYVYQDFEVSPKKSFGDRQAIRLPDVNTRQVNIIFKRVMFGDGTVLYFDKTERFDIPPTISVESLESELRTEIDSTVENLPTIINDYKWVCCCGRVNTNKVFCVRCGRDKEKQLEELNLSRLKELAVKRKEQEKQLQKEQEEQAQLQKQKVKRVLKNPLIITLFGIVLASVVCVLISFSIESRRSNESRLELILKYEEQAKKAILEDNEKEYEKFKGLIERQIKQCNSKKCVSLFNDLSFETAKILILNLD